MFGRLPESLLYTRTAILHHPAKFSAAAVIEIIIYLNIIHQFFEKTYSAYIILDSDGQIKCVT